jgi:hypothetical protein
MHDATKQWMGGTTLIWRWEDKIKIKLGEMSYKDDSWMELSGSCSVAGSCEHGNEPSGSIKGRCSLVVRGASIFSRAVLN